LNDGGHDNYPEDAETPAVLLLLLYWFLILIVCPFKR